MNGLEATAAIREAERERGGRLPIVAMTAHAMTGDRERCLAAGMDGYVAKPIRIADMFATIAAVVSGDAPPEEGTAAVVDEQKLLTQGFAGNAALLSDVIDAFSADAPVALSAMHTALDAGDLVALSRAAHKMKGTVGVFTTGPALAAAMDLESAARADDVERAGGALSTLASEIDALTSRLRLMRTNPV
jgi:CheY-like chemotaxis protein